MTTLSTPAKVRSLLPAGLPRPRLTIVPKVAARAPRVPFVILVVLVLGGGLIGLLLLNTSLQRGAYELKDLQSRAVALETQQQALEMRVATLRQPQRVAEAALALGMVRNDAPAFLDLSDGEVTGSATPAQRNDQPVISPATSHSSTRAAKPRLLVAGELLSESTGVVRVKRERPVAESGTGREQDTNGDTQANSRPGQGPQATNNTSNTR